MTPGELLEKTKVVPLDSIQLDPENSRIHPGRNLEDIERSLSVFSNVAPLLVWNGVVIHGNGRLLSLQEQGAEEVAVTDVSHLTEQEAKALSVAMNRTAESSEWDVERLSQIARSLSDNEQLLHSMGWNESELAPLLQTEWSPPELDEDYEPDVRESDPEDGETDVNLTVHFTRSQMRVVRKFLSRVQGGEVDLGDEVDSGDIPAVLVALIEARGG